MVDPISDVQDSHEEGGQKEEFLSRFQDINLSYDWNPSIQSIRLKDIPISWIREKGWECIMRPFPDSNVETKNIQLHSDESILEIEWEKTVNRYRGPTTRTVKKEFYVQELSIVFPIKGKAMVFCEVKDNKSNIDLADQSPQLFNQSLSLNDIIPLFRSDLEQPKELKKNMILCFR